jgi:hypothetical protein
MSGATVLRAAHHRLRSALDLDDALPAGADRVEERVVAEARHDRADLLGSADDERALGHLDLHAVDGERDEVLGRGAVLAHAPTSTFAAAASRRELGAVAGRAGHGRGLHARHVACGRGRRSGRRRAG